MENNYIVTTPSDNDTHGLDTLSWNELYAANFAFNQPFCLRLRDNQLFFGDQVIRVIPRRRMVAFGVWQGKQVVAKLFFDSKHAKRHMEKDIAGIKALQKNKIPTPEMYYEGVTPDQRIYVLIFERINDARNLEEIWRDKKNVDDVLHLLKSVIIEIATQHVLGLLQYDLHLKNFLLTEKTVYTLDGAQIEVFPNLLAKKTSMNNLALFLSQLGIDSEGYQEILFRHYAEARGWSLKQDDFIELFLLIKKWNDLRWKKFARKIFRNSSNFACVRNWKTFGMYNRSYSGPEFDQFLADPETVFQHPAAKLLKAGRSATVVKIRLDNRHYVVKRYNMKNFWHRVCRCLRPTRASSSWRFAQKLGLFDILTAKPAAFIERRILGFRGKSYYVTEYVSSEHAGDYFIRNFSRQDKCMNMIRQISLLLKGIAKVEITHGDLKITNILVNPEDQPVLIDLDGASEHLSMSGLRKAWYKEIERFLENFSSNPAMRKKFEAELGKW
ncbi:3-deoxy-D-manno-octulosonic acid kinase [Aquicella siphonis]|uniref:3-deoxy-D-manno-octulosonic acid kinase n=1 Tax=Aquicella siphonis TaxID=254247 RepID=A0A5E4PEJ5_9COXI|nr:lipopolysaccharide kinase InaA family protein [Aquicella siphonis]VVC74833.1 3-deoxy-D-manno-octulosonic acid kinase [Aquicella siphonis]